MVQTENYSWDAETVQVLRCGYVGWEWGDQKARFGVLSLRFPLTSDGDGSVQLHM